MARSAKLEVRCSEADKGAWQMAADAAGLALSEWARAAMNAAAGASSGGHEVPTSRTERKPAGLILADGAEAILARHDAEVDLPAGSRARAPRIARAPAQAEPAATDLAVDATPLALAQAHEHGYELGPDGLFANPGRCARRSLNGNPCGGCGLMHR